MTPLRELGVEIVHGDITDPGSLTTAVEGPEGVINCAAHIGANQGHRHAGGVRGRQPERRDQCDGSRGADGRRADGDDPNDGHSAVGQHRHRVVAAERDDAERPPYSRAKRATYFEAMARAA